MTWTFLEKNCQRFADSGGWGYAFFKYDVTSDTFTPATLEHEPPQGNDAKLRVRVPHNRKRQRLRFTEYAKR
jgi:hypothetical protein